MAEVTVFDADRMLAIENASIVSGSVIGDNLILEQFDGTPIDAGNVRGPEGDVGPQGSDSAYRVRAATTGNVTLSGTQTIDGVALVAGDRVLCKDQTLDHFNGIYVVAAGAWTRSTDFDNPAEISAALVMVQTGTANGGTRWVTSFKVTDTLNTSAMRWYRNIDGTNMAVINVTGTTDSSGLLVVTHGLPWTPSAVFAMNNNPTTTFPVLWGVDTIGATTFRMRFMNASTAGVANAISVGTQKVLCIR